MPWSPPAFDGAVLWEDLPLEATPLDAENLNLSENELGQYAVEVTQSAVDYFEGRKDQPNGYAGLDAGGKLKVGEMPSSVGNAVAAFAGSGTHGDGITDDTSAIQALLTAAGTSGTLLGMGLVYLPRGNYLISGTLVIPSNVELWLDPGATITLKAGSNRNMIVNKATANNLRVTDAVMNGATAALSSATIAALSAAAVNALIGQSVTVQTAGAGGAPLTTTVSAVTGSAGSWGLTLAANSATATAGVGAYAAFGPRDSNIYVHGGTWNAGANGAANSYLFNAMRFRQVDGIRVTDVRALSTNGKYFVNYGDVTRYEAARITAVSTSSDVVHINGPATQGAIRDIDSLFSGDDVVSMTCADFVTIANMQETAGDITDCEVRNIHRADTVAATTAAVKLIAGQSSDTQHGYTLSQLRVVGITGGIGAGVVQAGGDPNDVRTQAGTFADITFDDITYSGTTNKALGVGVDTYTHTLTRIEIRRVRHTNPANVNLPVQIRGAGVNSFITTVGIDPALVGNFTTTGITNFKQVQSPPDRNALNVSTGVEVLPRAVALTQGQALAPMVSGTVYFTYFTPTHDFTAGHVNSVCGNAAAVTPTLCRIGLYTVDSTGNLTLVASCANDTTLWSATFQRKVEALTASFQLLEGQRYAMGTIFVGATGPKVAGLQSYSGTEWGLAPALATSLAGQADLPASVLVGSLSASAGIAHYGSFTA